MRERTSAIRKRKVLGRPCAALNRPAHDRTARYDVVTSSGAGTPEELETLLEDALMLRDWDAIAALFEDGAVLVDSHQRSARGGAEIARQALTMWGNDHPYLANVQCITQARDIALHVLDSSLNVAHRSRDSAWRFVIMITSTEIQRKDNVVTTDVNAMHQLQPDVVRASEGEARWWFGSLAVIKATAASTGGQMSIVEVTDPPGAETPLHVHYRDDEGFWLLEGDATFEIGDTTYEAHAGDYLFGPRNIPHRYTAGAAGCRLLFILLPGGFEELVIGMSTPAQDRTLPPPSDEEPDWQHMAAVARAHGAELLA